MTDRDARIEAAEQHVANHFYQSVREAALGALAAADAAVPRAAWWEKCGECKTWGRPIEGCTNQQLVFALCDTCKGSGRLSKVFFPGVAESVPCPNCDDGTQRRRLRYLTTSYAWDEWWRNKVMDPDSEMLTELLEQGGEPLRRRLLEQMGGKSFVSRLGGFGADAQLDGPGTYWLVPEEGDRPR